MGNQVELLYQASILLSQELQDQWEQLRTDPGLAQPVGARDAEVADSQPQDIPGETGQGQLPPQNDESLEPSQERTWPFHNTPCETDTSSPAKPVVGDSLDLHGVDSMDDVQDVEIQCFFHDAFSVSHSSAK